MEMDFMVYNLVFIMKMTVYTIWLVCLKGRASAISFYGWGLLLGFRIEWIIPYEKPEYWRFVVNLKHSVRYESLVCLIRETRVHPSQLYISISGFISFFMFSVVNREFDYSQRTIMTIISLISLAFTALPRITAD